MWYVDLYDFTNLSELKQKMKQIINLQIYGYHRNQNNKN